MRETPVGGAAEIRPERNILSTSGIKTLEFLWIGC
jgi:hypothetical protein